MIMKNHGKRVFTTSHKPTEKQIKTAMKLSNKYDGIYISRKNLSNTVDNDEFFFVIDKNLKIICQWKDGRLFFHPSVSKIRLNNYLKTGVDYLVNSIKPHKDEIILDLTFGLGSDALLLGYFCKKVLGLEASLPIYIVVKESILKYPYKEEWLKESAKKIEILNQDYKNFLAYQEDNSYDTVYCDPMFENPQLKSSSMNPLRKFASYDTISENDLENMLRVARKRVVIKAHLNDSIWNKFHFNIKMGSDKSKVIFGVIEKQ
ncbi:O-methyltransferase [Petrotoga sp. 9PWA.NaAc.5.4]|nr:O-methyltransferase [Petrotoga sp. 9PWA.NaAc.5.4]